MTKKIKDEKRQGSLSFQSLNDEIHEMTWRVLFMDYGQGYEWTRMNTNGHYV